MREKTEPIKYIFRSRDEIQANVTVLQLLHIANLKLAEHERLKSLYEKKTPRPWKINAYWIKNEDHRMIPLSEKDVILMGIVITTTPGSGGMYENPEDETLFSTLPDDILFNLISTMDMKDRHQLLRSSPHVGRLWASNVHLELQSDEIYFEVTN